MIINSIADYEKACIALEVHPLISAWEDGEMVRMPIVLRVEIQNELFSAKTRPQQLNKFYRWCWEHMPHICEETFTELYRYYSHHISHILSRGAHFEKSVDPRNINILTYNSHQLWEFGTIDEKEHMRIYWKNQKRIIKMNREYQSLQPKNLKV